MPTDKGTTDEPKEIGYLMPNDQFGFDSRFGVWTQLPISTPCSSVRVASVLGSEKRAEDVSVIRSRGLRVQVPS